MADVAEIPVRGKVYDLAINIACLQIIIDQNVRDQHLREAYIVLKSGGIYFSCNIGVDRSVTIGELYERLGDLGPRKVRVRGEERNFTAYNSCMAKD